MNIAVITAGVEVEQSGVSLAAAAGGSVFSGL